MPVGRQIDRGKERGEDIRRLETWRRRKTDTSNNDE